MIEDMQLRGLAERTQEVYVPFDNWQRTMASLQIKSLRRNCAGTSST